MKQDALGHPEADTTSGKIVKKISEPAQSTMIYNSYWTLIFFSQGYVPLHKGLLPLVVNDPFTIGEGI